MAATVISADEVSLNAVAYKLVGAVKRSLSSIYPGKTVIGDYTKDSSPILSTLSLTDHRGGIGQDIYDGDGPANRSWYSTAETRFKGHLILPPLVTVTGNLPAGLTYIYQLMSYQGDIYANVNATTDGIYKYTSGTDTWGNNLLNVTVITNVSGRWATADINGKSYIVLGGVNGYVHFDGTTWTERTIGACDGFMASWDDRIWSVSITSPYKLWYTFTPSSGETILTQTPMIRPVMKVGQLFVARSAGGEDVLYLALPTGLSVYDADNDKWHETALQLPDNAGATGFDFACGVQWRGDTYFATRSSIYRYRVGEGVAEISLIGPDLDAGLPSAKGHIIVDMVASLNDLIVSTAGTSKTSTILAWNGQGWRVLFEGTAATYALLQPLLVAGLSGDYRLWWANNTTSPFNISWLPLPSDLVNPLQISTYTYAAAAVHDWPWFTAGQSDVTKVAVRVKVETLNPTTSETVILSYATDWVETFTAFATISTPGITTFQFPNSTTPTGTAFRAIRFRATLARGSTTTNTPDALSVTLEYYKKLDPKYQFLATLDMNHEYKGNTPKQLRAALLTAQESAPLVEFTYRDPSSNTDATFYVQVQPQVGGEETGYDERGQTQLLLVEV